MTRWILIVALALTGFISPDLGSAAPIPQALPTGQVITPFAAPGTRFAPLKLRTGPRPDVVADGASVIRLSPDGRYLAIVTSGFNRINGQDGKLIAAASTQYLFLYQMDAKGAHWVQTLGIGNNFSGLDWRPDSRGLAVSGGVDDLVSLYRLRAGRLAPQGQPIALGHTSGNGVEVKPQAAGLAFAPDGHSLLVANYYNDSLSLIDPDKGQRLAELDLRPGRLDPADRGKPGGEGPLAVQFIGPHQAAISITRDREIDVVEMDGANMRLSRRLLMKGEPTAMVYDPARHSLYAVEDNADQLAVVDTRSLVVVKETRLEMPEAIGGMGESQAGLGKGLNPNGLSLSAGGKGLLISLGGINAIGLIRPEAADGHFNALIPTAWYPSGVTVSRDGRTVFVINRKSPPGPNPAGCQPKVAIDRSQPTACGAANQYIFQLETSGLTEIPTPSTKDLARLTLQVGDNVGLKATQSRRTAEAAMAPVRAKIHHVIFVIKENRTYDQVLGDLEFGNGDPDLAILGARLSPNHHQLARQFVTLDNFYDSGEQSSTGWTWTTAGRVTDILEKTAPVNYAGRGLAYEAEGTERNINTSLPIKERRKINPAIPDDPDLLPGVRHVTTPDAEDDREVGQGLIWDAALRAGLRVRNYGMANDFIYDDPAKGGIPLEHDPYAKHLSVYFGTDRALAERSDPYYRGYDQKFPDYWRIEEFKRDVSSLIAANQVPDLMLVRISHDHFGDFKTAIDGVNTVETEMADNDYALGRLVDYIAHSPLKDDTLIFVIEDDAQNGADHVDARRSIAFVAGPYVKQGALVSTRYNSVNFLRTIEAVLGVKPMGLNDELAAPMADLFDLSKTEWTFQARAAQVLKATQLPIAPDEYLIPPQASALCSTHTSDYWAAHMAGQDFRLEDRLDTQAFNTALWEGLGSGPEPSTRAGLDLRKQREALRSHGSLCH